MNNDKVTMKDLEVLIEELKISNPEFAETHKRFEEFEALIRPYLHMTKEEMEIAIPHGAYTIGGGPFVAITGKGGLINVILEIQKQSGDDKN